MTSRSRATTVALLAQKLPCRPRRLEERIEAAVRAAAGRLGRAVPALSVAVVGDHRMRRLNREYHGVDATTDVLAFPLETGPGPSGEVIVCAPSAARRARSREIEPLSELLLYVVHGTLHLLGERDATREQAGRMRRLEFDVLAIIGHPLPGRHLDET